MVNSKKKGDTFERKVASILGEWWGYKFSRTPQSGGAHWLSDNNAVGDIVSPPQANFPLVIECKHRENWTIENIMLNNKEPHTWWQQVINDSNRVQKVPCLIFTRNRANTFVALPYKEEIYEELKEQDVPLMRTNFITENLKKDTFYYDIFIITIDTLTSFSKSYITNHYGKFQTKPYKIVESKTTKESKNEDKNIDDLLDKI